MGSDSGYPRARHRFGFSGPLTRQKKDRVTSDDILDSLTRQAQLRQKLEERDEVRLEEIAETEDLSRFQGLNPGSASAPMAAKNRSFGHLAFVVMLSCGLAVVWLFSSASKRFDPASLDGIIQKSGVQSIFANQAQLGIIALAALLGALLIRRRRRSPGRYLHSV